METKLEAVQELSLPPPSSPQKAHILNVTQTAYSRAPRA